MNNNNQKQKIKIEKISEGRRKFLNITKSVGIAVLGGFIWSAYVDEVKASSIVLRPPGALDEPDFLKTCIKCGMCVQACHFRDSNVMKNNDGDITGARPPTLKLAKPGDNLPIGTPFFIARDVPCFMCDDIPCVPVCPSGALDITKVSRKVEKEPEPVLDINMAKMGLAIVDTTNCIAFWGIQCDACYRACPILDKAITLEYKKNERTGKHAYLEPVVHSEFCTGCGLCELACVTDKPAIFVLPLEYALGKAGSHYIKGWDAKDEERLKNAHSETTTTKISEKSALDSLNNMDELEDLY
ncbi:MAG: ferredoxin-type protein NapG [Deltaproteobacteria bacterium]|nr:MAG: ferredoxin-type protein NapG [Deltaproteobacteria bacterium]